MQAVLIIWVAAAICAGLLAGFATARLAELPAWAAVAVGLAAAAAAFAALRPAADRWFVMQVLNAWPHLRDYGRGKPTGYERPIEILARRLVAAAHANEVDEVLIIGHSAGGAISPAIVARALEIDPDLGRHGPAVILMTVGSLLPGCALHPKAERVRASIRRIATEPAVRWIDCQARKDVMNFYDLDPVVDLGIRLDAERHNPLVWIVRLRDMLSGENYNRRRANYFRMHYQFIMGNDLRAPYDFFMLVCGPVCAADWAKRGDEIVRTFPAVALGAEAATVGASDG
jgi:hypothetical protein